MAQETAGNEFVMLAESNRSMSKRLSVMIARKQSKKAQNLQQSFNETPSHGKGAGFSLAATLSVIQRLGDKEKSINGTTGPGSSLFKKQMLEKKAV